MRWLTLFLLLSFPLALYAQWQLQDAHTTADLRGIDSVGDGIAWASGTEGTVLRTEDSGVVWQLCAIPPGAEHLDFRGIKGLDDNTAIVMSSGKGDLSRLYKTTDGCRTWKLVFANPDKDGFFDSVSFSPPHKDGGGKARTKGYVLGDPVEGEFVLFQSVDNGDSWSRRVATQRGPKGEGCKVDDFAAEEKESSFAASNQSLLSFPPYFIFVTGGSVARIGYTDHFDLDFAFCHDSARFIRLPMAHGSASSGGFAIAANERNVFFPSRLMIVGGDYQLPEATQGNSVLIVARNGFHIPFTSYFDLITPTTPPHGYRSSVAYDKTDSTWITVGPSGTDISTDDGRNWSALKPSAGEAPDADQHWNALSLPFVVGPHGRIGKLSAVSLRR